MSFSHLPPKRFTGPSRAFSSGDGTHSSSPAGTLDRRTQVGKGGGHPGGSRRLPVGVPYGYFGGWGGYDYDTMPPYTQVNVYPAPEEGAVTVQSGPGTYGRVGDLGTYDSALPVGAQPRAAYVDQFWTQLRAAVDACPAATMSETQAGNFEADADAWDTWYASKSQGPTGLFGIPVLGAPPLKQPGIGLSVVDDSTIDSFYGKALGWRDAVGKACGTQNLPVLAPQAPMPTALLGNAAALLGSVSVLALVGVGLWFAFPLLASVRK